MKYLIPLLLCACSTAPVVDPLANVVLVAPKEKVNVPDHLLVPCPAIQPLEVRAYSKAETVGLASTSLSAYDACRTKDELLIEAIKKAFQVEGSK